MESISVTITPIYAAVLALLFVLLSVRTLRLRRKLQIGIGFGNEPRLERAMRVHANFAEYVPIALILVFLLELRVGSVIWLHALCTLLVVGRVAHAFGVSRVKEDYRFRVFGMALTFATIISAAAWLLISAAF